MANISHLPPSKNFTPAQALDSAKNLDPEEVLCVGFTKPTKDSKSEFFVRSSGMSRERAYWLAGCVKDWILRRMCDDD